MTADDIEAQPLLSTNRSEVASTSSASLPAPHKPTNNHAADVRLSTTSQQPAPRICRFCFGEEGDAEDAALGKMITPCLCRDVVHIECLKKWRESSSSAFHACNVCKFNYRFHRLPYSNIVWIKFTLPLYPLALFVILVLLLGFWPIIAPPDGNFYIHLFNGFCALGLVYLICLTIGFNIHYCMMAITSARAISGGALSREVKIQLALLLSVRCFIVVCFFAFIIAFFWPLSAFMGAVFLCLITPTAVKDFGDKLIRRLESNRPVLEIDAQMAAEAAAEMAQAAAAEAARQRERELLLTRDVEEGQSFPQANPDAATRGQYIELTTFEPSTPPPPPPFPPAAASVDTLPGHHHSIMMMNHGSNIEEAIAVMRREHGSTVFLNLPTPPSRPPSPPSQPSPLPPHVEPHAPSAQGTMMEPHAPSAQGTMMEASHDDRGVEAEAALSRELETQVKSSSGIEKMNKEDPLDTRREK